MEKTPSFNNLPVYVKWNIIENFMHVVNKDTSINHLDEDAPDIFDRTENAEESFTTDANALACLAKLDRKSAQLAKRMEERYPSASLATSHVRILAMKDMGNITFKNNFASLIANNGNVSVPLDELSNYKVHICTQQLSEIDGDRLKNVRLAVPCSNEIPMYEAWMSAVYQMRKNNPAIVIELDLGDWVPSSNREGQLFASLLCICKVKNLDFEDADINSDDILAISKSLVSAGVRRLDLSSKKIDRQAAFALAKSIPDSQLETLNLADTMLGPEELLAIIKALPHSNLRNLIIDEWEPRLVSLKTLAAILPETDLTTLRWNSNTYDDLLESDGVKMVMDAVPKTQLTSLMFSGVEITADTLQSIGRAILSTQLTHLEIQNSPVGNDGAIAIAKEISKNYAAAENFSEDFTLTLSSCEIGEEGEKAIKTALVNLKLKGRNVVAEIES